MRILLAVLTGVLVSLMVFFNGSLDGYVGTLPALIFIHYAGLFFTSFLFIKKQTVKERPKKSPVFIFAGLLGIAVVAVSNQVFAKGGVLLTLSGTLAGQVLAASAAELIKHRRDRQKLPFGKAVSLALVLPGAAIIGFRSGLSVGWILLSWVPGTLIFIQAMMNTQNILAYGFRKSLLFQFLSVFLVLLPFFLLSSPDAVFADLFSGRIPPIFLFGGGAVALFVNSIGSYLLLRISPVTYVLLLYSGQLSGAIILDLSLGLPFQLEKLAALVLIVLGLFGGELKKVPFIRQK